MDKLIIVEPDKCVGCNACVRTCPAPEANITKALGNGKFITTVDTDKCIACGECVRNCTHGARDYIDDTMDALDAIKREPHIVIAAPAIKSVFPRTWTGILDWFKKRGCKIYDVSFGADICTWAHLRAIQRNQVENIITQPCAAIVKYIETYKPILVNDLSPIHSPMLCAVVYIRKYLKRKEPIIALSPCIAKKNEFMETGLVKYNVTFGKLNKYFEENNIKIPNGSLDFNYDFTGEQGQVGGIYPRPGGLRDNLWLHDPDLNITTSEGVHKVYPELDMMAELPKYMKPQVFDVLSCEFGCNVGAGTGSNKTIFDVMKTMRDVEQEAKSRRKVTGGFFRGAEDKLFKKFDEELSLPDFMRSYHGVRPTPVPDAKVLDDTFLLMGKHTAEDRSYNCHACGYRSCKDMAIAIARGLNTPENCVVHAKAVLLAHHSELAKKHEQLTAITDQCKELSKSMQRDMNHVTGNMSSIRATNGDTAGRVDRVDSLLNNIITYCQENPEMDNNKVSQLIAILETTRDAFSSLNDSINMTTNDTKAVDTYISNINGLVKEINEILVEIENV